MTEKNSATKVHLAYSRDTKSKNKTESKISLKNKSYGKIPVIKEDKILSQPSPEYITMIIENLNELNESFKEIASGLHGSSNGGGGGEMDDLKRRVNDLDNKMGKVEEKLYTIDKTLAIVEERTKKIDSLPSEDRMRSIIQEAFKDKDPASKEFVQNTVSTSETRMIKWQIRTGISIVALTSAIVFGILKYLLP